MQSFVHPLGSSGAAFSDTQTSETLQLGLWHSLSLYHPELAVAARDQLRAWVVQEHQPGEGFLEQRAGCCVGRQREHMVGEVWQDCSILNRSTKR